ncbi:barren [Clavulina sp. PMI_390]|nr:barren [Clavulina sp. PMI_390]
MPRRKPTTDSDDSGAEMAPPPQRDSESDDEPAPVPDKKSKGKGKRRPSAPFGDASNTDYTAPLKDDSSPSRPNIQKRGSGFVEVDDRAEKRKRRRSGRVSFAGPAGDGNEAGLSTEMSGGDASAAGPSNDLNRSTTSRPSMRTARMSTGAGLRINAVTPAPPPSISMDVMNTNFEEWMKMATDNKINAANSWSFALIDYFHDMSLLRNTDDNSINFQKASFTLDGCVKIWTSRVDSVGTETGKLLSNLAQDNGRDGEGNEDGEEDGEEGEGEEGGKKKQRVHRTEATLVKNYSQLQVKKLDLDFAVDPLFRKTRAEFDEGGATGLLMNHLGVNYQMRVVFDSGDSKITEEDDDEDPDIEQVVDIDQIRTTLLPSLDTLEERTIAQDLAEFRFSSDHNNIDFALFSKNREDDDPNASFVSHRMFVKSDGEGVGAVDGFDDDDDMGPPPDFGGDVEDFFTGDQAAADDVPAGGPAGFAPFGVEEAEGGPTGPVVGVEPFDPRRAPNQRDLVMAMNVDDDQDEMLDYFDSKFMKNWAGPEHWKLRRAVKKTTDPASDAPRTRKEKTVFAIDFLGAAEHTAKELFAPATKAAMITLPSTITSSSKTSRIKKSTKRDDHLLPDDKHFTSGQLLKLFLKPLFTLKMRRYGVASGRLDDQADGEVDEHFWAEANQMGGNELDETAGGGPIPFNTQFFHDDFDDGPGFDDDMDGGDGALPIIAPVDEEGDLLAATQGPLKRVRPEFVNYARKAKRVDVRKLKENIWKGLKIVTPKEVDPEAEPESIPEESLTAPDKASTFNSVINGLRTTYTKDKMEEISTSFCFICLLHLANERGLKIEVSEDRIIPDDDEEGAQDADAREEERRQVGDIWSLNVFRDPNAIASA